MMKTERAALAARFCEADLACARVAYRLRNQRMYERDVLLPDGGTRQDVEKQLLCARKQVSALEAPEPVFALMKRHYEDFLGAEALRAQNFFEKPIAAVSELSWQMAYFAQTDSRADAEKAEILRNRLNQTRDLFAAIERVHCPEQECAALAAEIAYTVDNYRHYAEQAAAYFPSLNAARSEALARAAYAACERMDAARQLLETRAASAPMPSAMDDDARHIPFTESYYRGVLHDQLGVELDDLLRFYEPEIEKTRAEVREIAAKLPIAEKPRTMREVSEALARYAGPCGSAEEMLARAKSYLARTRDAARDYVWFPEEVCAIGCVPYPLRESFPWGGYADGDGRRPITGTFFLNDQNYRAVTDGWIKMQAVHEAYPGHHLQYVRSVTDALPETMKLGAMHIPLIEGVAHRSERLFEFVFEEDPFYPLFVAFRRHHTAVRIKSDIMLRYDGRPIADSVALFQRELGFDYTTARGQVKAQERMEGYFTCYYYGMKRIADLEAIYGSGPRAFTETLFSCGNISMESLECFLRLDDAQKRSYRQDFRSLLMPD